MDKNIIDETSQGTIDETGGGNQLKHCPHCGSMKPLTERYCPMCGRDRSGAYAPYLAHAASELEKMKPQTLSDEQKDKRRKISGKAFAIAALALSLLNLTAVTLLTPITLPLVIIFIIISVKRGGGAKGMAIAAAIISLLTAIFFSFVVYIFAKIYPDMRYFFDNGEEIVMEYDKSGTIPSRYDKYRDDKYDDIWDSFGYDSFDEFFDDFVIEKYRDNVLDGKHYDKAASTSTETSEPSEDASEPTDTPETSTQKVYQEDLLDFA